MAYCRHILPTGETCGQETLAETDHDAPTQVVRIVENQWTTRLYVTKPSGAPTRLCYYHQKVEDGLIR